MTEEKKIENMVTLDQSPTFSALTARERYSFARFLSTKGANFRTSLDRIMYRGFDAWECEGVRQIISAMGHDGATPQHFFVAIGTDGRKALYDTLFDKGMCRRTADRRFSTGSFKEWELAGVNTLFNEWKSLGCPRIS